MTGRTLVLWCALALWGCPGGSDGGAGEGGGWECDGLTGTWEMAYEERSGTCGPLTSELVTFDAGNEDTTLVNPDCDVDASGDLCNGGRSIMAACSEPLLDGTPAAVERTVFLELGGPDDASGRLSVKISSAAFVCQGVYTITATRL